MQMKLGEMSQFQEGLNYLIRADWWDKFQELNAGDTVREYRFPPSNKKMLGIDAFLLQFKQEIIQELNEQCTYIDFQEVFFNPEVTDRPDFKPISPAAWAQLVSHPKFHYHPPILTYLRSRAQNGNDAQIRVGFCSKNRSDAFVGYLPENISLLDLVRSLAGEFGYIENYRTKFTFPGRSAEVSYAFEDLKLHTIANAPEKLILVFNLERAEEKKTYQQTFMRKYSEEYISTKKRIPASDPVNLPKIVVHYQSNEEGPSNDFFDDYNIVSFEPGELDNTRQHDRTGSTGAQTPFNLCYSFSFDADQQFRVNKLFGEKQPEEVKQMRDYAQKMIKGELIMVPETNELDPIELEKIANDLIEKLNNRGANVGENDKENNTDEE